MNHRLEVVCYPNLKIIPNQPRRTALSGRQHLLKAIEEAAAVPGLRPLYLRGAYMAYWLKDELL